MGDMIPSHFPRRVVDDAEAVKVTQAANAVRNRVEGTGFRRINGPSEADRAWLKFIERACRKVRIEATADECPWPDMTGPLAGITRNRAILINDVLWGYPVRYWTINDRMYDRPLDGQLGIFCGLRLEGEYGNGFEQAFDMRIATSRDDDFTRCGWGSSHCLGPAAIKRMDVLSMDPWDMCQRCGAWRPKEFLTYAYTYFESEEDRALNGTTMECKAIGEDDYCQ